MSSIPAFPRPVSEDRADGDQPDGNRTIDEQDGMSLRDYFAAKAMAGLVASSELASTLVAADAYAIADAMLKARDPKP